MLFPEFDREVADIVVGGGGGLAVVVDDGGVDLLLAADEGEKTHFLVVFDGRFARYPKHRAHVELVLVDTAARRPSSSVTALSTASALFPPPSAARTTRRPTVSATVSPSATCVPSSGVHGLSA